MGEYKEYLSLLYHRIPDYVYGGGLSLLILGSVIILTFDGFSGGWRKIATLGFLEYVLLIFSSTVVFRATNKLSKINLSLLDGYKDIITRDSFHIAPEMLMNVFVFIPLGFLLGAGIKMVNWKFALAIGCGISISVEFFQYFLRRGTAQLGDILHNTIGCMIGYGLFRLIEYTIMSYYCSENNKIK